MAEKETVLTAPAPFINPSRCDRWLYLSLAIELRTAADALRPCYPVAVPEKVCGRCRA